MTLFWQQIHWPRKMEPNDALQLLRHLSADYRNQLTVFEVRSDADGVINFLVGCQQHYASYLRQLIEEHIEGAVVTSPSIVRRPVSASYSVFASSRTRPLRVEYSRLTAKAILASMLTDPSSEHTVLQLVLGKRLRPIAVPTRTSESVLWSSWQRVWAEDGGKRIDREKRTAYRTKISAPGFRCALLLGIAAPDSKRRRELTGNVVAGIRTAEERGSYLYFWRNLRTKQLYMPQPRLYWPLRLNVNELLGLSAWPLGADSMPGVDRTNRRLLYAENSITTANRYLAGATAPGDKRMLGLSVQDALFHLHVLGPTGVGKSTLLLNLICQDIAAGHGVVVIDPKGDLVNDVLQRITPEREGDVVVLDPADPIAPVGLNPLRPISSQQTPEVTADHLLAVFHGLYEDAWGPRTQDILHASLLTLAGCPNTSLLMLPLLLTNPNVRQTLTSHLTDGLALGPFWQWYEQLGASERQQVIAPVMNKVRTFLLRPQLRAVIGQVQPKFELGDVMQGRKILLVSLAKGLLGSEASALLGSLVVAHIRQATLARAAITPEKRKPVMVYIDEFQDYMHLPADLADVLAQARSLGVGMTLAHQHLDQLKASLRTAVLANARSRVCFQLSNADAQTMAHLSELLSPEDFMKLGRYEIYASLVANGSVQPFASGKTLPQPPRYSNEGRLRSLSQQTYGQSPEDIDLAIKELGRPTTPLQAIGRRLQKVLQ